MPTAALYVRGGRWRVAAPAMCGRGLTAKTSVAVGPTPPQLHARVHSCGRLRGGTAVHVSTSSHTAAWQLRGGRHVAAWQVAVKVAALVAHTAVQVTSSSRAATVWTLVCLTVCTCAAVETHEVRAMCNVPREAVQSASRLTNMMHSSHAHVEPLRCCACQRRSLTLGRGTRLGVPRLVDWGAAGWCVYVYTCAAVLRNSHRTAATTDAPLYLAARYCAAAALGTASTPAWGASTRWPATTVQHWWVWGVGMVVAVVAAVLLRSGHVSCARQTARQRADAPP